MKQSAVPRKQPLELIFIKIYLYKKKYLNHIYYVRIGQTFLLDFWLF